MKQFLFACACVAATVLGGCSSAGVGVSVPIGGPFGVGVSVGSGGRVGVGVGASVGGVGANVGTSTQLPRSPEPAASQPAH
jgi:hypothetical protein